MTHRLLTPPDIRQLAERLNIRPTKALGQNFVHDGGTVRAIAAAAEVGRGDVVLEVGPGLGSLTLALLHTGAAVSAIELDSVLAEALDATVARFAPEAAGRFAVRHADALDLTGPGDLARPESCEGELAPVALVANLPYNVAVPIIVTALGALPSLTHVVVMVQAEVGERIAAEPGSRIYGIPSVKIQWYGGARRLRTVGRRVFWPVPNVDSVVVGITRRREPLGDECLREATFAVVDAAFAQRRKTLRAALARWAGSAVEAERLLRAAGIDPSARGEALRIEDFRAIALARGA
ncbi:MAG: 16S rRNA (adenine(1518)-N(6)/adenine(1519)-N(6))-dimethyltransferase RsmA [Bowdeniella nasicola]|nr:16S rRNA (adenine(1518)-N(6)/adenine(1519)-N(6))-dimethyltransferase RsmA [Bowdeniella nasicola]